VKRIESKENPTYRQWKVLHQASGRQAREFVFLEGYRLCGDALQSGVRPVAALIADGAAPSTAGQDFIGRLPQQVTLYSLPDRLFAGLCSTENPQGIALICPSPLLAGPASPPLPDGLYLVTEEIRDPGNLGNMIRTADAFAFDAVLLTPGTVYPFSDKVLRAAMGSCFHVPLIQMQDLAAIAAWLASGEPPVTLLAADPGEEADAPGAAQTGWPGEWPLPAALLIGNEANGISAEARRLCRRSIAIPMPGRAESLNAASAAAILCFELTLNRLHKRANQNKITKR
jgi:RNA methyltransferase, TrmH family